MTSLSNIARSEGDPKIIHSGPSSLGTADRLGRALGWFSLGLGLAELIAPGRITQALGMQGRESLVRAYGAREISSGIPTFSINKEVGLLMRLAGDALDIATVLPALLKDNDRRGNAGLAFLALIALLMIRPQGFTGAKPA